jgi:hypothetical protein
MIIGPDDIDLRLAKCEDYRQPTKFAKEMAAHSTPRTTRINGFPGGSTSSISTAGTPASSEHRAERRNLSGQRRAAIRRRSGDRKESSGYPQVRSHHNWPSIVETSERGELSQPCTKNMYQR